ncbi:MAG: hypothetical protein SPF22_07345 [Candidatus Onthovivens sp.]|nr:hypothetical protein [Candidatus Onthovivens sp.]
MLRAEVTIFIDKSDPVHYLEHRVKDIVSKLWKNDVGVTKVTFQEENGDTSYSCNIRERADYFNRNINSPFSRDK